MPRLYRNRYLTCFYCGRRTSTRYDGKTRRFDCPFCDATNYLDENGDITDPPVATEAESTPRQFAVSRHVSPPPSSPPASEVIFCDTCLKNQHLLNASLAQYLPDPDDPDYAEREKDFHRFRRNQERLYPQICEQCEPKVRQRLERAQYTAKADLLRRMLDRSASARSRVTTRGWPERFDFVGRWLWIAGSVFQLGWHAVVVHGLLLQYLISAEADDTLFTFRLLRLCEPLVGNLPSDERLLGWSSLVTILGVWWNPRFPQVYRGFTRHLNGVWKWYFFQAIAVALRVFLQKMDVLKTPNPAQLSTQTAMHALALTFALLILTLAPRCIRINMAPLFGTSQNAQRSLRDEPPEPSSTASRPDETKTIADLLDEISRSPVSSTPPSPTLTDVSSPALPRRRTNALPMGHTHTLAAQNLTTSLQEIDNLHLGLSPRRQPAGSMWNNNAATGRRDYSSFFRSSPPRRSALGQEEEEEEMDWSPTPPTSQQSQTPARSKYRAFNTQGGPRASERFGSAPTSDEKAAAKPFWYRVPPAPTTPAQRVFNPPNQPRLRPSPVDTATKTPSFRFGQQKREDLFASGAAKGGKTKTTTTKTGSGVFGYSSFSSAAAANGNDDDDDDDYDTEVDETRWEGEKEEEEEEEEEQQHGVTFAEPRFFAEKMLGEVSEDRRNDPRNELSGLFGESFKLTEEEKRKRLGWWPRLGRGGGKQQGKKD